MKTPRTTGSIMLLVIVFGGVFFAILIALSGFVLSGNRAQDASRAKSEAFTIAEAGLSYYRWFLSHFPGNTTNGTGQPGPYVGTFDDPEGGVAGTYSLSIVGNTSCGAVQSIDVTSTGTPTSAPTISSVLFARYAKPSVAAYSYIIGSSVWAGADRVINGPYHSNGGVRMDGTANAPVTSSLATWNCTTNFGCNPAQPAAPGVVGTGPNQTLWGYPKPQIDFAAISANFTSLKNIATSTGLYLPRYSTSTGANPQPHRGYHLIFNSDGTITVRRVNTVTQLAATLINTGAAGNDFTLINNETFYQTLTIPAGCGLIFVEDNVWLEGTIPSKVTLVAANTTTPGIFPDVVLLNNIVYAAQDGTTGFTVISAHDILIAPNSPQVMTLNGIFIAQSGAFGRNRYTCAGGVYEPRNTLTILGTTVSNLRTGTRWVNGCGGGNDAGYQVRIDSFDRLNTTNPPPFTPYTSSQWQFVDWQQKK